MILGVSLVFNVHQIRDTARLKKTKVTRDSVILKYILLRYLLLRAEGCVREAFQKKGMRARLGILSQMKDAFGV